MAGEWLKLEASTPDKAEVLAITAKMGWDDPDLTVGKLFRLWRWFDAQTVDGNAPSVTLALLDRVVGVSGFCDAMCSVGWLCVTSDGVSLPNFERHNGNTAKKRALTAKRVAAHKSNAEGNAVGNAESNAESVTGALPREEKKRIDISTSLRSVEMQPVASQPAPPPKPTPRGCRLPQSWKPSVELIDWAKTERPDLDAKKTIANFVDYWQSKAGKEASKTDWDATFRNWVRNERAPPMARSFASERAAQTASAMGQIFEQAGL